MRKKQKNNNNNNHNKKKMMNKYKNNKSQKNNNNNNINITGKAIEEQLQGNCTYLSSAWELVLSSESSESVSPPENIRQSNVKAHYHNSSSKTTNFS